MFRILVVDDELDVCDFVKQFFEDRGYSVATALDGEEALRILGKAKFDLMLLDITMRKMDGLETLEKVMRIDKDLSVIMVTAVDDHEKISKARAIGACDYITKPLVLEELENTVYSKTVGVKSSE